MDSIGGDSVSRNLYGLLDGAAAGSQAGRFADVCYLHFKKEFHPGYRRPVMYKMPFFQNKRLRLKFGLQFPDEQIHVRIGNESSVQLGALRRAPRGSVLKPPLFHFNINDRGTKLEIPYLIFEDNAKVAEVSDREGLIRDEKALDCIGGGKCRLTRAKGT